VVRAVRASGAEDFVFCSTGKAGRFLTADVYAGSKKLTEWIIREPQVA
jgi:hypothetical protein